MKTILYGLIGLFMLSGLLMFVAAFSADIEAGASAAWENSASAKKCFIHWSGQQGGDNLNGVGWGNGQARGGYVGIEYCSDSQDAVNICYDHIEDDFDCNWLGTTSQCQDAYCFE